jgi:tetratricopeptide (TPR) repeat protein
MSRGEAVELLQRAGAEHSPTVSSRTTMLVIGQDGWPLKADGRVTRKLQTARRMRSRGQGIEILQEDHFLDRLRVADPDRSIRGSYSALDLNRLLGVSRERLRAWERAGLVAPTGMESGVAVYGFEQVSRLRSLMELLEVGTSLQRIRRSLQQLRYWVPEFGNVPDWLGRLQADGSRLIVSTDNGRTCEPSGQCLFPFEGDDADGVATLAFPVDLFETAVRFEADGDYAAAVDAYQRLLHEEGPDADVCFNLGNVLYSTGERVAAAERFRQAVELDPDYSDAHYGQADALDELGRSDEARRHWIQFLQSESEGDWADYARSRLANQPA